MRSQIICVSVLIVSLSVSLRIGLAERSLRGDNLEIEGAHQLYYSRKYAEAIEAYRNISKISLKQETKNAIRVNMAKCYANLGEDKSAIQMCQVIIKEDPNGSYAAQSVHQIGNLFVQRYQYKEAIIAFSELADSYPNTRTSAIAEYLIAQYLYAQGQYEPAIECYQRFLEEYPTSPYQSSAVSSLIRLYTSQRRYVDAETLIRGRLARSPVDADMMERLADVYKHQGKYDKALSLYRTVLKRHPNKPNLRKKLGEVYAEKGQPEQAIEEWASIIESNPNQPNRYQQVAVIYTEHQMYQKATKAYQQAIQLNPGVAHLYTQLVGVYKIQGLIDMIVETYLQAFRAVDFGYSGRDKLVQGMAEIYEGEQKQSLFDRVIGEVGEELAAAPHNLNLLVSLAELYFFQGNIALALQNFRRLPELHPMEGGRALEKYAQLLERAKATEAAAFYETIIQVVPDTRIARDSQIKLARFYERSGLWAKALAVLKRMKGRAADSEAQFLLGHVWLTGMRDINAALPIYQALSKKPLPKTQSLLAQLGLAECFILKEQYLQARTLLEIIVGKHIKFRAAAQKLIGDSYLYQREFEKAIVAYKRVVEFAPADSLSIDALDRIVLLESNSDYSNVPLEGYVDALRASLTGRSDDALKIWRMTIEEYPDSLIVDDAWLMVGQVCRSEQAHNQAIQAYEQVVNQKKIVAPEALAEIADIYCGELRDIKKALETYRVLIRDYSDSVIVPYARQKVDMLMDLE